MRVIFLVGFSLSLGAIVKDYPPKWLPKDNGQDAEDIGEKRSLSQVERDLEELLNELELDDLDDEYKNSRDLAYAYDHHQFVRADEDEPRYMPTCRWQTQIEQLTYEIMHYLPVKCLIEF